MSISRKAGWHPFFLLIRHKNVVSDLYYTIMYYIIRLLVYGKFIQKGVKVEKMKIAIMGIFLKVLRITEDLNWITNGGDGTFEGLEESVKGTSASLYNLLIVLGAAGLILSLVFAFIMLGFGSSQKRENAKDKIVWVAVAAFGASAAVAIVGICMKAGANASKNISSTKGSGASYSVTECVSDVAQQDVDVDSFLAQYLDGDFLAI